MSDNVLPQHDLDNRLGRYEITPKGYAELARQLDATETLAEKLDRQAALNATLRADTTYADTKAVDTGPHAPSDYLDNKGL